MFVSFTLVFGGIYTALPVSLSESFGVAPATVGLLTSAVLLVTGIVSTQNGRLAARWSTRLLLVGGFALYAAGFFGVALAGSLPTLVEAALVFGFGSGPVRPTLFTTLSNIAPDHARGGVMSLQTTTIGASQAVGPTLFTVLGGAVGCQATLLSASGGAVLGTALPGIPRIGS